MNQSTNGARRLRLAVLAVVALVVLGTAGYHVLEGWPLLDCAYMAVITLSTVGFREVKPLDNVGKLFTMTLVVFGVGIAFWAVASLIEAIISEQVWHVLRRKRMQKRIDSMKDHYIICGFGRMGQQIAKDFRREGVPFVVIEQNPEQLPKLVEWDIPHLEGNASDDRVLLAAGIERAKGLITVLPTDEDNVFITLSARALNPNLYIVARSILLENENKLKMAGANRVMSPYVMGGRRMAIAVLRPNVLDFLELATHGEHPSIMMEEIPVDAGSCLVGKSLGESRLRQDAGVSVIAIKRSSGELLPNPSADTVISAGDVLIVLGSPEQLPRAEALVCPAQ
ncbi:MAG: potassium channel protein [Armatimonadota bacterium]|nr:potassium channel protein [Armatimonadota bacterium]